MSELEDYKDKIKLIVLENWWDTHSLCEELGLFLFGKSLEELEEDNQTLYREIISKKLLQRMSEDPKFQAEIVDKLYKNLPVGEETMQLTPEVFKGFDDEVPLDGPENALGED